MDNSPRSVYKRQCHYLVKEIPPFFKIFLYKNRQKKINYLILEP